MRWKRISWRSFWIQNGLWALFGCWDISKTVLGVFKKIQNFHFFKKHPKLFVYNSPTKYRSEAVLYSKRTAGYPLSPHIKTIVVVFFTSWVIKQQKWCILTILKKHPTLGVRYAPMEKVSGLNFGVLKVVIIWMKTGFLNFEDIPFPQKLRAVILSLKKGKSEWKMLPGTGECHIYIFEKLISCYLLLQIVSLGRK